jgi:hypothetical protein
MLIGVDGRFSPRSKVQVVVAAHVRFSLVEVEQPNAVGVQHVANGRGRCRVARQEYHIHLPAQQRGLGLIASQAHEFRGPVRLDLVSLEQREREGLGAAALGPDRDAAPGELRQPAHWLRAAVKDGERHVEYGAERNQVVAAVADIAGIAGGLDAGLDEPDIDP